ncbi:TetR/AcrR family transcriptional regulator [Homoserinimonas sp. A520]
MARRERTRTALQEAALQLFDENGYDATSAAAIAARAGVTEMTFFRHFATKDAVLMSDPYDPLIAQRIADQPTNLPPLAATVAGIRGALTKVPLSETTVIRRRLRIVAGTPSLAGAMAMNNAATEAAIAVALYSRGVQRADARISAAAVLGALNAAILEWAEGDNDDLGAAVERALRVMEGHRG